MLKQAIDREGWRSTYELQAHTFLPEKPGWLIEIETSAGESLLAAVIERIVNQGGQVLDVERDRPSLEVVFQRFTEPVDAEGQA